MLGERNNWRSENLWKVIPVLPAALAGIAMAVGVDYRYASASGLVLFLWVWFVHQAGPSPKEDPEFAFLRNIRVKLYSAGLFLYIFFVLVTVAISPLFALILYGVLFPVRAMILRGLFRVLVREDEQLIAPRNADEKRNFDEMRLRAAGCIIYLTMALAAVVALAVLQSLVSVSVSTSSPPAIASFVFTTALFAFAVYTQSRRAFTREMESRQYARNLADSLRRRRWARRFHEKS